MTNNRTTHPGTAGSSMALGANDPRLRRSQSPDTEALQRRSRDLALQRLAGQKLPEGATLAQVIAAHNRLLDAIGGL
jgi:hypothetical protein